MVPRFTIEYHLFDFRDKAGLTDRELAELSGISKTQINQIEDGKANPTLRTICILSLALDVQPADLFSIRISP
ncbi:helix-turn-helix transcriptional regulator [Clostridium sp. FS41]|uniref:helix-turn-helix domain-containing protein n=1 Tax=Clostridium sp. FS41 TaxID=1609975 RepID=UPI0005D3625B|nr:helix-turn-helix transcriptional regulator [Clostridium sp. FS41]KJJ66854.1 DNA-binding transcriptional repressor PuuR [Clostridium sp. FS41]